MQTPVPRDRQAFQDELAYIAASSHTNSEERAGSPGLGDRGMTDLETPASGGVAAIPTDAELLARWSAGADPHALERVVRRHGAMVLGVCRRVLGNTADADDAFQATFLVLVRKGFTLRNPEALGPWLHGVARRTSLKARSLTARRATREAPLADLPASEAEVSAAGARM